MYNIYMCVYILYKCFTSVVKSQERALLGVIRWLPVWSGNEKLVINSVQTMTPKSEEERDNDTSNDKGVCPQSVLLEGHQIKTEKNKPHPALSPKLGTLWRFVRALETESWTTGYIPKPWKSPLPEGGTAHVIHCWLAVYGREIP